MDGIQGTLVRFKAKKTQQSFSVTLAKCINLTFSARNTLIVKYLMIHPEADLGLLQK